ncbi:hypothetical protein [Roseateles depolymerans]|uniref:Uncharacterized protein n=2 Tax=Roseateles depolymerans TaxID=76731 RepID=A0A0U2U4Y4_9BURK|nr:hypothetical protein [Roseateles depolymerans]ALV07121.1 hypothetical protein RD2015_2656 [Roseateles depolymerans]REG20104.1 hypothetical protein DES44_2611 [Roseateles depolymerans]
MTMPMPMLLLMLLLTLLALPSHAAPLKKDAGFIQTRAQLLKEGWQPVTTQVGDEGGPIGTEASLIAAGIVEVESCAVDRPLCILNYRRHQRCLRLITSGEELPTMTVDSWTHRCPAPRRANGQ